MFTSPTPPASPPRQVNVEIPYPVQVINFTPPRRTRQTSSSVISNPTGERFTNSCRRRTRFPPPPPGSAGGAEGQCPATVFESHLVTSETCFRNNSQSPCRGSLLGTNAERCVASCWQTPFFQVLPVDVSIHPPPRGQHITTHILHNSRQPHSPSSRLSSSALPKMHTRTLPNTGLLGDKKDGGLGRAPASYHCGKAIHPSRIIAECTNTDTASLPELSKL